jgi:hypothetical protein
MTQPPKISNAELASFGIAGTRKVSSPLGLSATLINQSFKHK